MRKFDAERWRVLTRQIDQALDLSTIDRAAFLDLLRTRDPALEADLQAALRELDGLAQAKFLEHSLGSLRAGVGQRVADSPAVSGEPRYEIGVEHARGGMGRILRATDTYLDRTVAIKELLKSDPETEARFMREAKLTARLQHPSIVPVHDAGRWQASGKAFYSMKLIGGESLSELVSRASSLRERLVLLPHLLAVTDAIAYAHSEGVIHRDLKPSNVLIGEYGETLVVDWGLAKQLTDMSISVDSASSGAARSSDRASLTALGTVLGTPAYMPPEQARGGEVDRRADVYALGASLYYVISGKPPYQPDTSHGVVEQVLTAAPTRLLTREPAAPPDLCAIVDKAMARAPVDRYPSARELAADLRLFLNGQLVSAHDYSWRHIAWRWIRRHRAVAALSGVFILLALVGSAAFVAREQRLRHRAEAESRRADTQSQSLLLEHGRRELEEQRPSRAAVYLADAYLRDPLNPALRWLVTEAVRPLRAHLAAMRGHTRDVVAVTFSPDGTQLATGSTDTTVRLWNATTGESQRVLHGPKTSVEDVAWSPDGRLVASGDRAINIWDARSGQLLRQIEESAFRLRFSPDGKWLVAGAMNGRLLVWDATTFELAMDQRPHRDRVAAIAFHPHEPTAVTASWDGTAILWALPAWTPIRTLDDHHNALSTALYSPDGTWLLTGDSDNTLYLRNGHDGQVERKLILPDHSRSMNAYFDPDGRTLITSTIDGVIRAWHASSGTLLFALDAVPHGKLFDSALSPDGRTLATVGLEGGDLWRLDRVRSQRVLRGSSHERTLVAPASYSSDGRRLVTGLDIDIGARHALAVYDAQTGSVLRQWAIPGSVVNTTYALAASGDLSRVIAGHGRDVTAVWDGTTGQLIRKLDHRGEWVRTVAASADGTLLATGGDAGIVRFWRGDSGEPARESLSISPARVTSLAFSRDLGRLAVVDSTGQLRVRDLSAGAWRVAVKAHPTWIEAVEFSEDGRWLVTAGRQDHTAKVWDAESGRLRATLVGHGDNLSHATFSPDGKLVATVCIDRTARIWDANSGEVLRELTGPTLTARFSPSGRELLTTGEGDYLVLWSIELDPRSPTQIAEVVRTSSPWQLTAGRLTLRTPPTP